MKVTLDEHGSMYVEIRKAPGVTLVTDAITDECNLDKIPWTGEIVGIEVLNVDLVRVESRVVCNHAASCNLPQGPCQHHDLHIHDKCCDYGYCGMTDRPFKCVVDPKQVGIDECMAGLKALGYGAALYELQAWFKRGKK